MRTGVLVSSSYAIWTNAYIGTHETYRSSLVLASVIAVLKLSIGIADLADNTSEFSYMNPAVGVMFAVLFAEMAAGNLHDRHFSDIEEE